VELNIKKKVWGSCVVSLNFTELTKGQEKVTWESLTPKGVIQIGITADGIGKGRIVVLKL
jgi:hypothetical protein